VSFKKKNQSIHLQEGNTQFNLNAENIMAFVRERQRKQGQVS